MADFRIGRLKFNFRGAWQPSTAYEIDDIVNIGGNSYVATANHTSVALINNWYSTDGLGAGTPKWAIHLEGVRSVGSWTAAVYYNLNDVVKFGNTLYRCTVPHLSAGSAINTSNFSVYIEGLKFEDSWQVGTQYQPGDLVTYGGYTYVALTVSTGVAPSTSINTDWDVITTGFKEQGVYSGSTAYVPGDLVRFGGYTYVCKANVTGTKPNAVGASTYWSLVVQGMKFVGVWNPANTYLPGEVVYVAASASSYINLTETNSIVPGSNSAVWELLSQGDTTTVNINAQLAQAKAQSFATTIVFGM